jgi:hypothetical protein
MKIESNLEETVLNLITKLQNIDGEFTKNALLEASYQTLNKIKHRIQDLGENASGVMISRARSKIGAYSTRYAVQRHKKGLQTLRVDLTVTGDLMREFQITHWGANEVWLGFFDQESSNKADKLEE